MKKRTFSDGNNFPIHQVWTLLDKSQRDARHNNARYCSLYIEAPDGTEMRARLSVRCKLRALKERVAADLSFASSEKAGGSSEREHSQRSADGWGGSPPRIPLRLQTRCAKISRPPATRTWGRLSGFSRLSGWIHHAKAPPSNDPLTRGRVLDD